MIRFKAISLEFPNALFTSGLNGYLTLKLPSLSLVVVFESVLRRTVHPLTEISNLRTLQLCKQFLEKI